MSEEHGVLVTLKGFAMFALLCVFVGFASQLGEAQEPEALALEQKVLEHRRSLRNGRLKIVVVRTVHGEELDRESSLQVAFDGTKLRVDHLLTRKDSGHELQVHESRSVRTDEVLIHSIEDPNPSGVHSAVKIRHRDGTEPADPLRQVGLTPAHPAFFDPRIIGLDVSPTGGLHGKQLEIFVGRPDRTSSSASQETLDGRKMWRVEYVRISGGTSRMWIDPDRAHNLVKAEAEYQRRGSTYLDSIECQLAQFDEGGVWFPQEVVYRRQRDGELLMEEKATVKQAVFNQGVEAQSFELAGMDIPPDTALDESPPQRPSRIWDGKSITVPSSPPGPVLTPARSSPWRAYLIAANLAFLAILFLALYIRSRGKAPRSG